MDKFLKIIGPVIESGLETRKIDLKREYSLDERPKQAKLAKLISALANTPGGSAYIVIGVKDKKDRHSNDPSEIIVGFNPDTADSFQRQLQQAVTNYIEPRPTVNFYLVPYPNNDRILGVVHIRRSFNRPHRLKKSSGKVEQGVYLKRGSETMPATPHEIEAMEEASQDNRLILNFSRPLTNPQLLQLRELLGALPEIIKLPGAPVQFSNELPLNKDVVEKVDSVGLTTEEWQTLNFIINLPGLTPAASAVIAEVHGRSGHFPHILRLRPKENDRSQFEVAEIVKLQNIRDAARNRNNQA